MNEKLKLIERLQHVLVALDRAYLDLKKNEEQSHSMLMALRVKRIHSTLDLKLRRLQLRFSSDELVRAAYYSLRELELQIELKKLEVSVNTQKKFPI